MIPTLLSQRPGFLAGKSERGGTPWSDGVSHGELLRDGCDETMTVDPQNIQLLYQGLPRGTREPNYDLLPYRLALLRPAKTAAR